VTAVFDAKLRGRGSRTGVQPGANVKVVQRMLGHSSAAMTLDVYADLFDDDLTGVADKLDETVGKCGQNAPRPHSDTLEYRLYQRTL
jgi:integrase